MNVKGGKVKMKLIEGKNLGPWDLMPAPKGTCPECAVSHSAEQPHNQQSMFYQYKFYNEYGRFPTWKDAMDHCPEEIKNHWIESLNEVGVKVE